MTTLTQPGEMTIAPAFMTIGEADFLTVFDLVRLAPEQIVGAYSLIEQRRSTATPQRPHLGHTGHGLFFPK